VDTKTIGKPEWLLDLNFARGLWEMAGLKERPEREYRGVQLRISATWVNDHFYDRMYLGLRAGAVEYRSPETSALLREPLLHLTPEFQGHHFPPFGATVIGFVSQSDKKFYMVGFAVEAVPPLEYPRVVISSLAGTTYDDIRMSLEESLRDLQQQIKKLKGWGYL
jgi:hypothetical protein